MSNLGSWAVVPIPPPDRWSSVMVPEAPSWIVSLKVASMFALAAILAPTVAAAQEPQPLKLAAMGGGLWFANLFGVGAEAVGVTVQLANGGELLVGDPCSGLRSLIALMALGFLLAFGFSRLGPWGKLGLVIGALPVAFASNVLRIGILCTTAGLRSDGSLPTWIHDLTGMSVYVIALVGLLGLDKLFSLIAKEMPWRRCAPA